MSGIYDHVAVIGDWVPPSPSTRAFFSSFLNDDISSKNAPENPGENNSGDFFMRSRELMTAGSSDKMDMAQASPQLTDLSSFSEQKSSSRGGLVERIAARAGFNAPRLNTEGIRCPDLSFNPDVQSPYLTIPPGLSPTTLLDSPVFVSNSLAQPSPTTGKFSFMISGNNRNSTFVPEANDKDRQIFFDDVNTSSFAFKPVAESGSSFFMSASSKMKGATVSPQCFPSVEGSVQSENTFHSLGVEPTKFQPQSGSPLHCPADISRSTTKKDESATITTDKRAFDSLGSNAEHPSALDEQQDEEGDQRVSGDSTVGASGGATPSEDGYNWRKYGQKQVKGSEYPRSYYKCTHPNCPVKKKVERSHEGHITEIIYKSAHNHPKPPPSRRSTLGSSNQLVDMQLDASEQPIPQSGTGNDSGWASTQRGTAAGTPDWRIDNVEVTSSASGGPEFGNPSLSAQAQNGNNFEPGDAVDASSTFSNDDDEDDRATHGSIGYEGEGEESDSKRRKLETYAAEMSGATRAIREPRVVVQTTSEVDILDDGYRWRKYGQKVVKGNPNPRSYYKCTNAGCTVRKHVERASHDLKSVITTYEGKHNHDVPAARNSSHVNSGSSGGVHSQAAAAAAVPAHVHRPETSQVHNSMTRFDRSAAAAYGSFSLPGRQQLGPPPNFSFGMNQVGLANLTMAGLGSGHHPKMPLMPVHPYLMQQRPVSEMGYVLPKGEPKVEPLSESSLNMSNNPTVYQQIMSRLPLGPHR